MAKSLAFRRLLFRSNRFAEELHHITPDIALAAWDIAIDEKDEPVFIEVNTYYPNSINPQLLNGPFFGEYTDAVLDHTLRKTSRCSVSLRLCQLLPWSHRVFSNCVLRFHRNGADSLSR